MPRDAWGAIGGGGCVRVNAVGAAASAPPAQPGVPGTLRAEDLVRTPAGALPREALLTTFVLDAAWVARLVGPRCRTTVVADASAAPGAPQRTLALTPRLRVVLAGGGSSGGSSSGSGSASRGWQRLQHAKLAVLRFDDRVRVAVASANLTPGDWAAVGQCVWAADFARTDALAVRGPLADDLCAFLRALLPAARDALYWTSGYDTRTTRARLVFSVPGVHAAPVAAPVAAAAAAAAADGTGVEEVPAQAGLLRLRQLLGGAGALVPGSGAVRGCTMLVAGTSSLGVAHDAWLRAWPGATPHSALRIVYPTEREMDERAEGVFFCTARAARAAEPYLARLVWRDPQRAGLLSHAKMLFWLGGPDGTTPLAAYYGSANFSGAAWGAPLRDGTVRTNNYELGVLLVPEPGAGPAAATTLCPSPFVLPPPRYARSDVPYQT